MKAAVQIRLTALPLVISAIVFLLGCSSGGDAHQVNTTYEISDHEISFDEDRTSGYVSGIVTVWFEPDASDEVRSAAVEAVDGEVVGQLDAFDQLQLSVPADDKDELQDVCSLLEEQEGVAFADLDRVVVDSSIRHIPDDDWGDVGYGSVDESWWLEQIDAPEAWSFIDDGKTKAVTLGVVDAGFDVEHEDLADALAYASDADEAYRGPSDHGTHVAGLMAARWDNQTGIAGANPIAKVLCFDASRGTSSSSEDNYYFTDSDLLLGLYETVSHGAKVVNYSIGASGETPREEIDASARKYSRAMGALLAKGNDFVVVQSAGNSGVNAENTCLFAGVDDNNCDEAFVSSGEIIGRILVVAACDNNYNQDLGQKEPRMTAFSNGGKQATVCAPGDYLVSCVPGDEYEQMSGTSMAAPIVTGVCGLVWGSAPDLTGADVARIVKTSYKLTPVDSAFTNTKGGMPIVNANLAVRRALLETGQISEHENVVGLYQNYLMDIVDSASETEGDYPVKHGHIPGYYGEDDYKETYYGFAIGDMDGDGVANLLISCEQGSYDSACPNVVYGIDQDSGEVYELESSGLLSRITGAKFYRNQVIELLTDYSNEKYFLGANDDFYDELGVNKGNLLCLSKQDDGYYLGTTSYYAYNQGPALVTKEYRDTVYDALTDGGELGISFQQFTAENIKRLSVKNVPEIKEYQGKVLPKLDFTFVGEDAPGDYGLSEVGIVDSQSFVGMWQTEGGDWPNTAVTVMENGEFYIEGSPYEGSHVQDSGTWRALDDMDAFNRPGAVGIILEGTNENYWMSYDGSLMMFHFFEAASPMRQIA